MFKVSRPGLGFVGFSHFLATRKLLLKGRRPSEPGHCFSSDSFFSLVLQIGVR